MYFLLFIIVNVLVGSLTAPSPQKNFSTPLNKTKATTPKMTTTLKMTTTSKMTTTTSKKTTTTKITTTTTTLKTTSATTTTQVSTTVTANLGYSYYGCTTQNIKTNSYVGISSAKTCFNKCSINSNVNFFYLTQDGGINTCICSVLSNFIPVKNNDVNAFDCNQKCISSCTTNCEYCGSADGKYGSGYLIKGSYFNAVTTVTPLFNTSNGTIRTIYLGCFYDAQIRNLDGLNISYLIDLTAQKCALFCNARSFTYFGLEVGSECHCGNSYGKYGLASSESDCYASCDGWSEQKCGAPWRINIYKIVPGNLYEGDRLNKNEMLISQNGLWMSYLSPSGLFSIYDITTKVLKWKATTVTSSYLAMQTDSNLVLYDSSNSPKWATGYLQGVSKRRVEMANNGTLAVYDGINKLLWKV